MGGTLAYDVTAGAVRATSDPRTGEAQLLSLAVETAMDGVGGRCVVELAASGGAAVVQPGDAVTVKLDGGSGPVAVFTGTVYAAGLGVASQTVRAGDAVLLLANAHAEAAYEEVASDFIAKDLIGQAGATAGTVSPGPSLAAYTVHGVPTVLAHLRHLAGLAGADIYTDGDGKVHVAIPRTGGADHSFAFDTAVLGLDLRPRAAGQDGAEVWGEGAADAGAKPYVLTGDISALKGQASLGADGTVTKDSAGTRVGRTGEGAVRSAADVKDVAAARAAALAARRTDGFLLVAGTPEVLPGDLVSVTGLPDGHPAAALAAAAPLRVRAVRHSLDRRIGFRTRMEF